VDRNQNLPKILQLDNLNKLRQKFPKKKIILISGCFDILHIGHIGFIEAAKKQADILVIGILSDKFVKKRKGQSRPIFTEMERLKLIVSLEIVDYAFIMDTNDVDTVLQELSPNFYGIGGDRDKNNFAEKRWLNKYNVKVKFLPRFGEESTTTILKRVLR